jgi:hypothetical protein
MARRARAPEAAAGAGAGARAGARAGAAARSARGAGGADEEEGGAGAGADAAPARARALSEGAATGSAPLRSKAARAADAATLSAAPAPPPAGAVGTAGAAGAADAAGAAGAAGAGAGAAAARRGSALRRLSRRWQSARDGASSGSRVWRLALAGSPSAFRLSLRGSPCAARLLVASPSQLAQLRRCQSLASGECAAALLGASGRGGPSFAQLLLGAHLRCAGAELSLAQLALRRPAEGSSPARSCLELALAALGDGGAGAVPALLAGGAREADGARTEGSILDLLLRGESSWRAGRTADAGQVGGESAAAESKADPSASPSLLRLLLSGEPPLAALLIRAAESASAAWQAQGGCAGATSVSGVTSDAGAGAARGAGGGGWLLSALLLGEGGSSGGGGGGSLLRLLVGSDGQGVLRFLARGEEQGRTSLLRSALCELGDARTLVGFLRPLAQGAGALLPVPLPTALAALKDWLAGGRGSQSVSQLLPMDAMDAVSQVFQLAVCAAAETALRAAVGSEPVGEDAASRRKRRLAAALRLGVLGDALSEPRLQEPLAPALLFARAPGGVAPVATCAAVGLVAVLADIAGLDLVLSGQAASGKAVVLRWWQGALRRASAVVATSANANDEWARSLAACAAASQPGGALERELLAVLAACSSGGAGGSEGGSSSDTDGFLARLCAVAAAVLRAVLAAPLEAEGDPVTRRWCERWDAVLAAGAGQCDSADNDSVHHAVRLLRDRRWSEANSALATLGVSWSLLRSEEGVDAGSWLEQLGGSLAAVALGV